MNKKTLIDGLIGGLTSELKAVIQYTTYAANASGLFGPKLDDFFSAEIPD